MLASTLTVCALMLMSHASSSSTEGTEVSTSPVTTSAMLQQINGLNYNCSEVRRLTEMVAALANSVDAVFRTTSGEALPAQSLSSSKGVSSLVAPPYQQGELCYQIEDTIKEADNPWFHYEDFWDPLIEEAKILYTQKASQRVSNTKNLTTSGDTSTSSSSSKEPPISLGRLDPNNVTLSSLRAHLRAQISSITSDSIHTYSRFAEGNYFTEERGIVLSCFSAFLEYCERAVRFIVYWTKNEMGIEIFYLDDELSPKEREGLVALGKKVYVTDLTDERLPFPIKRIDNRQFQTKPASILNSRFKQVLFLDADCYLAGDPRNLFELDVFKQTGVLMWPDYWKTQSRNAIWEVLEVDCRDEFEVESGQIMFDKEKTWHA
ncbi:hypothetical protein HK102_011705 [Quaeritorhiza haematococci]|nr:hypothetical protein HK102_011705 [Quaeritorhiza haematococci]